MEKGVEAENRPPDADSVVWVQVRVEVSHGGVAVRQDWERCSMNFGGLYLALCRDSL